MELSSADIGHFADNSWAKVEQLIDPVTLDELRRAYEELEVAWAKQLDVTVATHRETISQITNLHRQKMARWCSSKAGTRKGSRHPRTFFKMSPIGETPRNKLSASKPET